MVNINKTDIILIVLTILIVVLGGMLAIDVTKASLCRYCQSKNWEGNFSMNGNRGYCSKDMEETCLYTYFEIVYLRL